MEVGTQRLRVLLGEEPLIGELTISTEDKARLESEGHNPEVTLYRASAESDHWFVGTVSAGATTLRAV